METSKIRDRLMSQKALYQKSVEESAIRAAKIKETLDSITEDDINVLREATGVSFTPIKMFDLERMKTDQEYLQTCQTQLEQFTEILHKYLEDALNV